MSSRFYSFAFCPGSRFCRLVPQAILSLVVLLAAGCGGGNSNGTHSNLSDNTTVVLLASGTANDQLSSFPVQIESLTLTNKAGETVSLLASPVSEEFIHLNGHIEPLATMSVPQGDYVAASATYGTSAPVCNGQASGGINIDHLLGGLDNTINLPEPIAVTGKALGLVLNLQVSTYPGECPTPAEYMTFPPVTAMFDLTPLTIAAQPTNSSNGLARGLEGTISAVASDEGAISVDGLADDGSPPSPPVWQVSLNNNTLLQGVSGPAQLTTGMPVDIDVAIQPDGTLLAQRVSVMSSNTTTLTTASGPLLTVSDAEPVALVMGTAQEGYLPQAVQGSSYVNFSNTGFAISGEFGNLASLPFSATFDSANLVPGQNVTVTTQATTLAGGPAYTPLTTMTLRPQTIDGVVSATSSAGNFTMYTVTLAPFDLFPQFAIQPGQTTLLTNPNTVVVYADSNTQMLNSSAISVGGLFRFYGLVFNDKGTLRMDCAQVNDGVSE